MKIPSAAVCLVILAIMNGDVLGQKRRSPASAGSRTSRVATFSTGSSASSAGSGQPVDFDCPEEFGYYSHPTDCTQYYVCVFGGALLESCTGGLMYSHELQTCDWPRNVGCAGAEASGQQQPEQQRQQQRQPQQQQPTLTINSNSNSRPRQQTPLARAPPQRETIPVPKHDLYTEEELGPAEEIETDRQQRVYRGQPATIGQVASDRDAIPHTNAIPIQSSGGRDKLSVVSFGSQQFTSFDPLTDLGDTRQDNSDHNFFNNATRVRRQASTSHQPTDYSSGRSWIPSHPSRFARHMSLTFPQPNPPPLFRDYRGRFPDRLRHHLEPPTGFTFGLGDAKTNRPPPRSHTGQFLTTTSNWIPSAGRFHQASRDYRRPSHTTSPPEQPKSSSENPRGQSSRVESTRPEPYEYDEEEYDDEDYPADEEDEYEDYQECSDKGGGCLEEGTTTRKPSPTPVTSQLPSTVFRLLMNPVPTDGCPPGSMCPDDRPATTTNRPSSVFRPQTSAPSKLPSTVFRLLINPRGNIVPSEKCSGKGGICKEDEPKKGRSSAFFSSPTSSTVPSTVFRLLMVPGRVLAPPREGCAGAGAACSTHTTTLTPSTRLQTKPSQSHRPPTPEPHNVLKETETGPDGRGLMKDGAEEDRLSKAHTQRTLTRLRASVAPQQAYIETASPQPSRAQYNATQYIAQQYDPYYTLYDEEGDIYKDVDYPQYSANQGGQRYRGESQTRKQEQPTLEIVQQDQRTSSYTKNKYNNQQDLYQPAIVPSDYETYSIQTNDDIQYRPVQTKSSNRLAPMANGGAEEVVGNREEITDGRSSPIPAILKSSPQDPVHDKDDSLNQLVLTETTDRPRQSTSNSGRTQDKSRKSTVPSTTPVPTTDARKYDIIRSFLEEQSKKGAEAPRPFSRSRETQKTYPPRSKIVEDYTIRQQTRYRTAEEPPGRNRVVPEIAAIVQEYAVTRRTTTDSRRTSESRRRTPSSRTTESPRTTTESILSFERELEKFNNLSPTPDEPRPLEPVRTTPQTSSHRPTTTSAAPSPTTQSAGRQCTTDCADRQSNIRPRPASYESQTTPGYTRGTTRHRGSLTYTLSPNEAEPPNRGTPASRARPTLKPSTSIVSKASEFVDIYKYPPKRPDPVYPTPQVDKTAAKCRKDVCLLPDCYCGGKDVPGELPVEETPQLVLLTFDDSVNDLNKGLYSDLFEKGRTNPNGCPIAATFYVSHEWTDYSQVQNLYATGHEIASHSVSHSFGEQFSQKKWTREIAGQREILAAYGGVRQEDIRGMRAPFLAIGGNKMFKMLYDANFTYDSSMPVYENKPPSWPYTMDYKIFHDCMIPPCPTRSYPGVWEVPMVMWQDLKGGRCSMGDACSNPPTADGVYKMLIKNFERHFTSNRAPFGLFYHAAWFTQPHHKEGFIQFIDTIVQMPEVWLVSNWQAIQWVRDPTPISRLNGFTPFQCNYPERPKKCNNPKVCNLWHKSGVRYMRTCQPCPEVYPWTGKTGVRTSRVDNQVFEE